MNCRPHRSLRGASIPSRSRPGSASRDDRRGIAVLLVLVFLGLAGVYIAGWLTSVMTQRKADRLAEERAQAAWLAESGLERAAAKLAQDTGYRGELWRVPSDQLADRYSANINIKIERPADGNRGAQFEVEVESQLLDGETTLARAAKRVLIRPHTKESP